MQPVERTQTRGDPAPRNPSTEKITPQISRRFLYMLEATVQSSASPTSAEDNYLVSHRASIKWLLTSVATPGFDLSS